MQEGKLHLMMTAFQNHLRMHCHEIAPNYYHVQEHPENEMHHVLNYIYFNLLLRTSVLELKITLLTPSLVKTSQRKQKGM